MAVGASASGGDRAAAASCTTQKQQQQQHQQHQKMRTSPLLLFLFPVSILAFLSLILVVYNGFVTLAVAPTVVGQHRTVLLYRAAIVNDRKPVIRSSATVLESIRNEQHLRVEFESENSSSFPKTMTKAAASVAMERTPPLLHSPVTPSAHQGSTSTTGGGTAGGSITAAVSLNTTSPPPVITQPSSPPALVAPVVLPVILPSLPANHRPGRPSRRSRALLRSLQPNSRTRRFSTRAAEFFSSNTTTDSSTTTTPCSIRFFMTWISPAESFTRRELFCIESLFKSHPKSCLLILSPTLDSPAGDRILRPFTLRGYRIAAVSPSYSSLLKGTPAESWFARLRHGQVPPGSIPLGQNLSNLIRLAALFKYGGAYLDADVVVLKCLLELRNVIGAQAVDQNTGEWVRLNNAVIVFDKAHPLVREFIAEFAATFDGSRWGHNGPYLVSRVAQRWYAGNGGGVGVGPNGVNMTTAPESNFSVLSPEAFYPVGWTKVASLFTAPTNENGPAAKRNHERWVDAEALRLQSRSYAVHLWNRHSRGLKVERGSVVARIMTDRCVLCDAPVTSM